MEMMQESVTETQVNEMLQLADLDKDGKINYEGKKLAVWVSQWSERQEGRNVRGGALCVKQTAKWAKFDFTTVHIYFCNSLKNQPI